jgi:hypothetical protein
MGIIRLTTSSSSSELKFLTERDTEREREREREAKRVN